MSCACDAKRRSTLASKCLWASSLAQDSAMVLAPPAHPPQSYAFLRPKVSALTGTHQKILAPPANLSVYSDTRHHALCRTSTHTHTHTPDDARCHRQLLLPAPPHTATLWRARQLFGARRTQSYLQRGGPEPQLSGAHRTRTVCELPGSLPNVK